MIQLEFAIGVWSKIHFTQRLLTKKSFQIDADWRTV